MFNTERNFELPVSSTISVLVSKGLMLLENVHLMSCIVLSYLTCLTSALTHWTCFLCIYVSDICVTKPLVTLLTRFFLFSFSHINIMSRKIGVTLQIFCRFKTYYSFIDFRKLFCTR